MSNAANWIGGSPAGDNAAELSFPPGVVHLDVVNDIPGLTIKSLSFIGTQYSISGNAITLMNGEIGDSTLGPNIIACEVVLSGDGTLVVDGGDFFRGDGLIFSGRISGAGSVVKLGPGRLVFSGSLPNTYSGETHVRGGLLQLAKSPGINAVPGNLFLERPAAQEYGYLEVTANEQIPDTATLTAEIGSDVSFGAFETVGPLVLQTGARLRTSIGYSGSLTESGTVILSGDISILPNSGGETTLYGNFLLSGTRAINGVSNGNNSYVLSTDKLGEATSHAGLILRATPSEFGSMNITGTYTGPTMVEGARVTLRNSQSAATLKSGRLGGIMKSVHAEGGTVTSLQIPGELRLDAAVTCLPFLSTPLSSGGPVTIGGVTLSTVDFNPLRQLGQTHVLLSNSGSDPINGTFAGLPEGAILQDKLMISYKGGDGNDITLKQVGTYSTEMRLSASKSDALQQESVTFTAQVLSFETKTIPTGTVTFRQDSTVLGTVALTNGTATWTAGFPYGRSTISATYSGNDSFATSEGSRSLVVYPPKPTITSITPDSAQARTLATIIIRGTDFFDGSTVVISSTIYKPVFVSSTELRLVWDVPAWETDIAATLHVDQPEPGAVMSNSVPIKIIGNPLPPSELNFEANAVSGPVTPGALSTWLFMTFRNFRLDIAALMTGDTDNDGVARVPYTDPQHTTGIYTMVDMTSGTLRAGSPSGKRPPSSAMPAKSFMRGPSGKFSHIVLRNLFVDDVLLVRPGVGTWRFSGFPDGDARDLDGVNNSIVFFDTTSMVPLGTSPAPPSGVEAGDLFLGVSSYVNTWFGDRVDAHLNDNSGAGVIAFANVYAPSFGEKAGVARVTLMRTDGSDGTVSVRYATSDDTALAGIQYQAVAGTVTFGDGEILKKIEIPILNDALYSGDSAFKITLSDPAGTTIAGPATLGVRIQEDDPIPLITVSSAQVQEGSAPGQHVDLEVTLAGATRVPAKMNWYWYWDGSSVLGGALVFQPGETRKTISVPFNGNTTPDPDKVVSVWVYQLENAAEAVPSEKRATIKIFDDDQADVSVIDVAAKENSGTIFVPVKANITGARGIAVSYRTVDGTARAGVDYTAKSGSFTITPGSSTQWVMVPLTNNTAADSDRWFRVELTQVTGALVRRSSAIVVIVDDDVVATPVLTVADITVVEGNSGSATAGFDLKLSAAGTSPIVVRYSTADETAKAPADYSATSGEVTFAPGERQKRVNVAVKGDTEIETDETFLLRLESTNTTLDRSSARCTIRNDDAAPGQRRRSTRH